MRVNSTKHPACKWAFLLNSESTQILEWTFQPDSTGTITETSLTRHLFTFTLDESSLSRCLPVHFQNLQNVDLMSAAPEVIRPRQGPNNTYDGTLADVWSVGVMLYVMLFHAYPFERTDDPPGRLGFSKVVYTPRPYCNVKLRISWLYSRSYRG